MRKVRTVLFVDDDELQMRAWVRNLGRQFSVLAATSGSRARSAVCAHDVDLAIVDQTLDGERGLDVVLSLRELRPGLLSILTSANLRIEEAWRAGVLSVQCQSKVVDWRPAIAQIEAGLPLSEPGEPQSLAAVETEHIARIMRNAGSITQAARVLGLTRQGLRKKLNKLGLSRSVGGRRSSALVPAA